MEITIIIILLGIIIVMGACWPKTPPPGAGWHLEHLERVIIGMYEHGLFRVERKQVPELDMSSLSTPYFLAKGFKQPEFASFVMYLESMGWWIERCKERGFVITDGRQRISPCMSQQDGPAVTKEHRPGRCITLKMRDIITREDINTFLRF